MRIRQTENKQLSNTNQVTKQKITACYERLSRDDGAMDDSSSIAHQKQMLESYAAQHGFTNCQHYTDDGWSGSNFDRPGWKKLLEDIDAGLIQTVLVKDMSRVGRDYLQTGFYTEVFFRERNIRFIAIGNGVDSADQSTSEFAPFLNIMNEWYLRDCSRKQCAAVQQRGRAGQPTTHGTIYGYRQDPVNKSHWLVDEEAAAVVRRIYQMSINGNGPYQIARALQSEKIERPSYYLGKQGIGTYKSMVNEERKYDWSPSSVRVMIAKPEYKGYTVNFRSHKDYYKDKYPKLKPSDQWLLFEGTHEAIVDAETWQLAQKARKVVRRTDHLGAANPLTGLVYCADCGQRMFNHRARPKDAGQNPIDHPGPRDHFRCSTHNRTQNLSYPKCSPHYVSTKALRAIVLDTIRIVSTYAIENEASFEQRVRAASEIQQQTNAKALERKLNKSVKRDADLNEIIKRLYEAYATGHLQEQRFDMLLADYEKEQAQLQEEIIAARQSLTDYQKDGMRVTQFKALAKKYTDFSMLTTPMLLEFVDRILVHEAQKIDGERMQEIEVYLNFVGNVQIPTPEPTPEEAALAEKKRKRRAQQRKWYHKKQERLKQEVLTAKATALEQAMAER